jgi:sugar phosphate permease
MWLVCIQQGLRAGASRFYDNWLPTYLQEERDCSIERAANLSSWPQYAAVVGSLIGGLLSDWILRRTGSRRAGRQGVAIGSLLVGSLFFVAAYHVRDIDAAVLLLSAGAFVTIFASPCAFALVLDMGGRHLAVVFGAMNMVGNLGAFAFVWAAGSVADRFGWGPVLVLFAGAYLVAAVCWLPIDPNGVIGEENKSVDA